MDPLIPPPEGPDDPLDALVDALVAFLESLTLPETLTRIFPVEASHLPVDELLGEAPPASWGGALSLRRFEGAKKLDEWAFFHAPSRTLIVTDLAFNYPEVEHWWTRWFFTLTGALGKFGPTRILLSFVDDVAAAKESVAGMCRDWDFERVIVAHGEVREGDAREALAVGWAAV